MDNDDSDFELLDAEDIEHTDQILKPLGPSQIAKIQAWLQPTDYSALSSEYGKHRNSHLAGTGSWLYHTAQYHQWHNFDVGALWVKAAAGSGKSVIAASTISKLVDEGEAPVLYFFFRQLVSANVRPLSLVRDFMSQLLHRSFQLQHVLNSILEERRPLDTVSFEEMWRVLVSSMLNLPRVYCIIDALDEMEVGNESFLEDLVALGQRRPKAIKILMTSRPVLPMEQFLRHESVIPINLQSKLVNPDIHLYLEHRIAEFMVSDEICSRVYAEMSQRADGFFLYARLMMDELLEVAKASKTPEHDLIVALGKLPMQMTDMYSQMLQDHSKKSQASQSLQVVLLQWVTQAERPLRLLELSSLIDVGSMSAERSIQNKSLVRHGCGPLLEILEDETVCPIHHSFTEYLYNPRRRQTDTSSENFPVLDYKNAHRSIALTCVKLLRTDWYHAWHSAETDQNQEVIKSKLSELKSGFSFLDYAANNWHLHLRKSDAHDETLCIEVYELLTAKPDLVRAWLDIVIPPDTYFGRMRWITKTWTPLHIVAEKGISHMVEFLVTRGADIEAQDGWHHRPLCLAAMNGHTRTLETLLRLGAKNNEADLAGLKPLHHAAMRDHGSTVTALLKCGIDPFTPKTAETPGEWSPHYGSSTIGESAVMYACQKGQAEAVQAFLPYLTIDHIYQALVWAWQRSQTQVAPILLNAPGIDVNHRHNGQTLLFLASEAGDTHAIKLLLAMGADVRKLSTIDHSKRFSTPNHSDQQPQDLTPLHAFICGSDNHACRWNLEQLTEGLNMLLDAEVDINSVDSGGWTILHHLMSGTGAIMFTDSRRNELVHVLSMLLDRGMSATSLTADGANALSIADGISISVIDLLIDRGVSVNKIDINGDTPLITALRRRDLFLAQALLDRGANPNIADSERNYPLHLLLGKVGDRYSWRNSRKENRVMNLAKSLVNAGADVCARNHEGNTALHLASDKGKMLHFFLKNGFDLETKNDAGQTVLYLVVRSGNYQVFLEAGADACTRDSEGRTLLHCIVKGVDRSQSAVEMLQYFVSKGNSLHATDDFGNSLWHIIAQRPGSNNPGVDGVMDFLVKSGVSPTTPNHAGRTPLHDACCIHPRAWSNNQILHFILSQNVDVNPMDNYQITPLHLAASLSLPITARLLELGADLTASTNEGQTALMAACRARQCDRVCLLLDYYKDRQQLPLIDQLDNQGRSALHYACRSGRPESVALLLDLGASVHVRDRQGLTPLHICSDYLHEKELWDRAQLEKGRMGTDFTRYPSYIARDETARPQVGYDPEVRFRIRETIRLLIANGADTSFLTKPVTQPLELDPLSMAINKGCETMVNELLKVRQKLTQPSMVTKNAPIATSHERGYDKHRISENSTKVSAVIQIPEIVSAQIKRGEYDKDLLKQLLKDEDEPSIEFWSHSGALFSPDLAQSNGPITQMVRLGFTGLVRELGHNAAPEYPPEMRRKTTYVWPEVPQKTMLEIALARELPNMEMVKLLVSEFKADVNEEYRYESSNKIQVFHRPIHQIAQSRYWWQTRAVKFLLDQGCDIEARNSEGETALMIALKPGSSSYIADVSPLRTVRILLEHGANPNAVNNDGKSCLSIAADRPELFKLLLKYGADPFCGPRSTLSDAVENQNIEVVRLLLEAKIDVNRRPQTEWYKDPKTRISRNLFRPDFPDFSAEHNRKKDAHNVNLDVLSTNAYPLHTAASHFFNRREKYAKAIIIIEMLLQAGADPWLKYDSKISILHTLAEQGGIMEPFAKSRFINLESRDYLGRTILLAACDHQPGYFYRDIIAGPSQLIEGGASVSAVDDRGRTALHCLVDARPGKTQQTSTTALDSMTDEFLSTLMPIPDGQGRTAFHYALTNFHFDLIDSFISKGADPFRIDPVDGTTALHHLAARLGTYDDIPLWEPRILTPADISSDPNDMPETLGVNARTYLLEKGLLDAAKLTERDLESPGRHFKNFLELGLSINVRDKSGETPLFKFAAQAPRGWPDCGVKSTLLSVLTLFEDAGADFAIKNLEGESVLHKLAAHSTFRGDDTQKNSVKYDLQQVVTWLLSKGVDVGWEDTKSRTCLDIAATSGAQWLLDMYKR